MRYFIQKLIILLLLSGSIFDAQSQTSEVVRSNEKVVVAGKFYYLHIVREKQTMFSICKAYGVDIKKVMKINRKKTYSIDLNEILRIPFIQSAVVNSSVNNSKKETSDYFYHVIQKGNTLYSLSKQFNQSIENIKANNPEIGVNGNLTVGTVLKIQKRTKPQQADKKKNTYIIYYS